MLLDKAETLIQEELFGEGENAVASLQARELKKVLDEWLAANVVDWTARKAEMECDEEVYRELLSSAFINLRDTRRNTALHTAVLFMQERTVEWLLDNGADAALRMLNADHYTPLTLAARLRSVTIFQQLAARLQFKAWAYGKMCMTFTNLEQVPALLLCSTCAPTCLVGTCSPTCACKCAPTCADRGWGADRHVPNLDGATDGRPPLLPRAAAGGAAAAEADSGAAPLSTLVLALH